MLYSFKSYVCKQNLISSTRKVGVTAFDTKRWLCENTVHAHSHGHKDTVFNPSDLFFKSYLVNYFANVGILSHNDLLGTTPLSHGSVSDTQSA